MARDRATAVVAAVALAALAIAPWSGVTGASALVRAFSGETMMWPLRRRVARHAAVLGARSRHVDGARRRGGAGVGHRLRICRRHRGRRLRPGRRAGAGRADGLSRASRRPARPLRRRSDGRDDRRRHRRAAAAVHLLSGRQIAVVRRSRQQGEFRARARRRAPADGGHLVDRLPGRRRPLRRRDQFGAARRDRRRAVHAPRPRAGAGRAARRTALLGPPQGDVDPADHHAAVRDRAGAGRAVRSHRPHHGVVRAPSAFPARAGSTACPA